MGKRRYTEWEHEDLETIFMRVLAEQAPKALGRGEIVSVIFQNPLVNPNGTGNTSEVFIGSASNMIYHMVPGQESPVIYAEDLKDLYVRMSFALAEATFGVGTFDIEAAGTDYVVGDIITLTNGDNNATFRVDTISVPGGITGITLLSAGTGITTGIKATTSDGAGIDATINVLTTVPTTCELSCLVNRKRKGGLQ